MKNNIIKIENIDFFVFWCVFWAPTTLWKPLGPIGVPEANWDPRGQLGSPRPFGVHEPPPGFPGTLPGLHGNPPGIPGGKWMEWIPWSEWNSFLEVNGIHSLKLSLLLLFLFIFVFCCFCWLFAFFVLYMGL